MAQIPNKLLYFSQGSTYRTKQEDEEIRDDSIVFVEDDASIVARQNIFGVRGVYPGTCTTAAATAAKVATTTPLFPLDSSGKPLPGTTIAIKFNNTNTYKTAGTTMTLNVNSTGAYPIYYNNAEVVSTTSANTAACGYKDRYTYYIFNGTQWVWLSYGTDTNTTYSNASLGQGYAIQNNESESDTVTATLSSYALTTGGIVAVKFIFDVPCVSNPTLNVNAKGAKAIYHNGSPLKPGIIKSGDTVTFIYDGTYYHIISIDKDIPDPATTAPIMDGTATVGTSGKYAKEDHVHPSDTSRVSISRKINNKPLSTDIILTSSDVDAVPTTRTVNGKALSSNITLSANDVGALPNNTHIPNDIKVGSVAGKLYRNDVNGGGNFTVKGNSGCIPNVIAGTFLVSIYAKSTTQSYTFGFNFGSVSYNLSTTNGEINDVREITIPSDGTFSGSILNGSVASGTILYVVMYNYLTPVSTVGVAAVTNRYSDLDGTPTIPTVPTNISSFTNDVGYITSTAITNLTDIL